MPIQSNNASGASWSRAGVTIGAGLSVTGNATHTVLTPSDVNLTIRIVLAVFLPVILFVAVEIFVRVAWRRSFIDYFGRATLIVLPAIGAAYVSFHHLHDLALLSGEDTFGSIAGPVAIDGLMLGATVALLAIRAAQLTQTQELPAVDAQERERELDAIDREWRELDTSAPVERDAPAAVAPVSPVPTGQERQAVRQRAGSAALATAVRAMVIDGVNVVEAAAACGVGLSTLRRYVKVHKTLHANPHAAIDCRAEKVRPELVDIIREHARTEATR